MDDKNVEDVPFNQELEGIMEASNEETSMGSFHALKNPFAGVRESFKDPLKDSHASIDAYGEHKSTRMGRSRRSRHKPSITA